MGDGSLPVTARGPRGELMADEREHAAELIVG